MHGRGACVAGGVHGRGHAWWGACVAGCVWWGTMHVGWGGMHGGGHVWQGACVAGGMRGGGCAWWGTCMVGGHAWWGACVVGGMHGRGCVWQILLDTVNERAVRILLEFTLVLVLFSYTLPNESSF